LFVMDSSGARQRLLTAAGHLTPTFSPDGQQLAFVTVGSSGPQLQVGATNGAGAVPVYTATPGSGMTSAPDWSPDGRSLVISDNGGIEQVPAAGGISRTLISPSGGGFFATPSYSPDGSRLVFAANPASGRQSGLFISSANGTRVAAIPGTGASGTFDSQPDWAVPPGTGITVQQQDINAACSNLPATINPQGVVTGNAVPIDVTVDVPGSIDITVASEGGGSTLPIARDLPSTGPTATASAAKCKTRKCAQP
jgi:dipeptidyl aminopeptidase/acylaminoacyl peptidase